MYGRRKSCLSFVTFFSDSVGIVPDDTGAQRQISAGGYHPDYSVTLAMLYFAWLRSIFQVSIFLFLLHRGSCFSNKEVISTNMHCGHNLQIFHIAFSDQMLYYARRW